MLLLYLALGG